MRRKNVGGRRRTPSATVHPLPAIPLFYTAQDEHTAAVYDSESDDDNNDDDLKPHVPVSDFIDHEHIPEPEPADLLDENICISCNKGEGALLVCSERGCPIAVHVSCIGSEPKFDASGNFYCPYCWYKRAVNKCQELREKAMIAKQALSSFLDNKSQTVRKDEKEHLAEPAFHERTNPVQDCLNRDEPNVSQTRETGGTERKECFETARKDKGKVSATGSSVSETKDSSSVAKKGHAKRKVEEKVASVKKSLLQEHNNGDVDEEVTSSRTSIQSQRSPKQVMKRTSLTGKRKRLHWTAEEENALKEGVLKFSTGNQNIPWRKILEFGCRVFDKTRTPVDLKDKWKNIISKEGCK